MLNTLSYIVVYAHYHYDDGVTDEVFYMTGDINNKSVDFIHFFKRIMSQISIQHFLYLLAFTTFGIGDALTGALLMNVKGVGAESNVFFSHLYSTQGPGMFITTKLWITLVILLLVFISFKQSHKKSYWATNGFLAAISIGGIMAIQANIQAIYGYPFIDPSNILLIYLTFVFILVMFGDLIDSHMLKNPKKDIFHYHGYQSERKYQDLKGNKYSSITPRYSRNYERK